MKTLTKNLAKRSLSVLLVLMMVFSILTIGITSVSAATHNIYLKPTFTNGDTGNTEYKFTHVSDSVYELDNVYIPEGNQTFKVTVDDKWIGKNQNTSYGTTGTTVDTSDDGKTFTVPMANYVTGKEAGGNVEISVTHAGYYKFTYDLSSSTFDSMIVQYVSASSGGDSGGTTTTAKTVYFNNASNWSTVRAYYWDSNLTNLSAAWPGNNITTTVNATVQLTSGSTEGYTGLYKVELPANAFGLIFNNESVQTADITNITDNGVYQFTSNKNAPTFLGTVTSSGSDIPVTGKLLWADIDGDITTSDVNDRVYVELNKGYANCYMLYLPSGVDVSNLILKVSDGTTVSVNNQAITTEGTAIGDVSEKVMNDNGSFAISGDFTGTLYIRQSANVSSLHTITEDNVPMEESMNKLENKDKYNSENDSDETGEDTQFVIFRGADNSVKYNDVLAKIKGRGNSSWDASNRMFGKYAFNITLGSKTDLLGSGQSKKYCLVSYNADEARMRNMIAYELSNQIGLEFSPKFEPVDFYNNGRYIGSYLLTDKVEIGSDEGPLVNITDLEKANKKVEANKTIFEDETFNKTTSGTKGQPGYKMYAGNLTDPGQSKYLESGFLLELELDERFDSEFSGFISSRGQEIVCKYPEYATKEQIEFIETKWNDVESLIYDTTTAKYEDLDELIDVESFAKMYLIQELSKNLDAGSTSYYVYYHEGKLHAGVTWDYDWAFGQYIENGENDKKVAAQTMGKFITADGVKTLDQYDGWWVNSRRIYPSEGNLNLQAQLCQQDDFWDVVKAEWNENFYSIAKTYVTESVVSNSGLNTNTTKISENISSKLSGKIKTFYDKIRMSTYMDEARWGFIAKDPISTWGSKDTGDTHNQAVISLNNFILNRINWMHTGAKTYHLSSTDYTIQPPVLSVAIDMPEDGFEIGTEVVLNIDDKTDGSYVYTIYKNGTVIGTTQDNTYPITVESGENVYTVKAKSTKSQKESDVSNEVTVEGSGYPLSPTLSASAAGSVLTGTNVTLVPSIAEDYTGVTYEIYYKVDGGEAQLLSGRTYTQDTTGTVEFYVVATATVEGETITAESDKITVKFTEFTVALAATNNGSIMQSQSVTITATPSISENVTYTFYKGEEVIPGYENVMTNTYTEKMDDAGTFEYKVVATYSDRSAEAAITVTVAEFDGTFTVKILFKSSTVGAYRPNMKVNGTLVTLTEETAIEVDKVGNGISTYRWYSYTFVEDQTYGTEITVNVTGNRDYFYNASYTFEVGNTDFDYESNGSAISYYFALDNLNNRSVSKLSNISGLDAYIRNWTQSATHMIYNENYDGALSAPVGFSFRFADFGDANCDGKINIKDATYVQKSLANIVKADTLSTTVSDYNRDGKVTIKDATAIQKRIAGL